MELYPLTMCYFIERTQKCTKLFFNHYSEVKYTTPITPSTNGQFEGGKKYTYNITVKNTGITIENANIVPWGNGDSSDLDADIAL